MESLASVLVFLQSNVFVLCFKITHKDQIPGSCSLANKAFLVPACARQQVGTLHSE